MNLYLRLLWLRMTTARRPKLALDDVAVTPLRVMPRDLDQLGHVNNGVYLTMMDLGRLDLLWRSGTWARLSARGIYPVVAAQTISYRRSLEPWQRFELHTRIVGYDDRAAFIEQRFVVGDEIHARAIVRGRFLRRSGGTVTVAELGEAVGVDLAGRVAPEWVTRWAADAALPPARGTAPNDWA